MSKQVSRVHYVSSNYSHLGRWVSYYHQVAETLARQPSSLLEIGIGDAAFGSYIRRNTSIAYTSVDIAADLQPDVLASVDKLPFEHNSFDLVVAFEVLEHLPFTSFPRTLAELCRVSRKNVIVSLPHFGPPVKFLIKLPFIREIRLAFKLPYHPSHHFDGEHYWEIGKHGYSLARIKREIEKFFIIHRDFIPFENQYHHFFILEKR